MTDFVGKTFDETRKILHEMRNQGQNVPYRVISDNQEPQGLITADFRTDRYNFTVVNGIITECFMG